MREIDFITGNKYKFEVAKEALKFSGIKLIQKKLETPEIQSDDVFEIASFSATWASNQLHKPVLVTDVGYYIKALNGFPGPFIKFINQWLSARDILNLMRDKKDRVIEVRECLVYCRPGEKPVVFKGSFKGNISLSPGRKGTTSINEIFIPEGFNKCESELSREAMKEFWGKSGIWKQLALYLEAK